MRSILRRGAAVMSAAVMTLSLLATDAQADEPAPPALPDGFGLTQVPTDPDVAAGNTAHDFTITVTTSQVEGPHRLRIILPTGYYQEPSRRYPVLYMLHGAGGSP